LEINNNDPRQVADEFLKSYSDQFQKLFYEAQKAQWVANTDINDVTKAQLDLARPLAKFMPRLVKMAPAGERPED
jgi:hypothetical protein